MTQFPAAMPPHSNRQQTRNSPSPQEGAPGPQDNPAAAALETLGSHHCTDHRPSSVHKPASHLKKGSDSSSSSNSSSTLAPPTEPDPKMLIAVRSSCLLVALLMYIYADVLQGGINVLWEFLRSRWWFQSVYFETVWATVTYAYLIPLYPFALHYVPVMDRFKVDTTITYVHQTRKGILLDAVVYMAPLALMDTLMVKRYCGADPQEWRQHEQHWIQTTRALPLPPPTLWQLCYQVIGGLLIYDALFFVLHLTLHKHRRLYKWLHACHHEHGIMHAHITNKLSVGERIMLILAANQALKILYSHPLSRAAFVPVFIFFLIDNHSGYDLPWGLQHVLPRGVWGGPRLHHAHHMVGSRHYQPFLTYLDHAYTWWEGRRPHVPAAASAASPSPEAVKLD